MPLRLTSTTRSGAARPPVRVTRREGFRGMMRHKKSSRGAKPKVEDGERGDIKKSSSNTQMAQDLLDRMSLEVPPPPPPPRSPVPRRTPDPQERRINRPERFDPSFFDDDDYLSGPQSSRRRGDAAPRRGDPTDGAGTGPATRTSAATRAPPGAPARARVAGGDAASAAGTAYRARSARPRARRGPTTRSCAARPSSSATCRTGSSPTRSRRRRTSTASSA